MSLAAYYAEHGESDKLLAVEAVLCAGWLPTVEIAEVAGTSEGWTRDALKYLLDAGRAVRWKVPSRRGVGQHMWRLPRDAALQR